MCAFQLFGQTEYHGRKTAMNGNGKNVQKRLNVKQKKKLKVPKHAVMIILLVFSGLYAMISYVYININLSHIVSINIVY